MANPELYPRREHVRRTDCYVQHDTKMTILGSQVHVMLDDIEEYKQQAEAAERERDDALAWHAVASAERDGLRLRADRYRKDITQIVKVLELDPLEVDIPDILAAVREMRTRLASREATVPTAGYMFPPKSRGKP